MDKITSFSSALSAIHIIKVARTCGSKTVHAPPGHIMVTPVPTIHPSTRAQSLPAATAEVEM